jgi:hypothetical protein
MPIIFEGLMFVLGFAFPLTYTLLKLRNSPYSRKSVLFFFLLLIVSYFVFSNYSWLLRYFSDDVVGPFFVLLASSVVTTSLYLTLKYSDHTLPRFKRVNLLLWGVVSFYFALDQMSLFWTIIHGFLALSLITLCLKNNLKSKKIRYSIYYLFVLLLFLVTFTQFLDVVFTESQTYTVSYGIAFYYLLASLVYIFLHTWQNQSWGRGVTFEDVRIDVELLTKEIYFQKVNSLLFTLLLVSVIILYINHIYSFLSTNTILALALLYISFSTNKVLIEKPSSTLQ